MSEPSGNELTAALAGLAAATPQRSNLVEDLHRLNEIQQALSRRLDTVVT